MDLNNIHIRPFEDFQKNAMREAMEYVYSWKQEHPKEYSQFSKDMMKIMHNDFSCYERIFKMAAGFIPTYVLIECKKLLATDSENILSVDERAAAVSRVTDELMELRGYLRFGLYTETVGEKDSACETKDGSTQTPEPEKQFLISELSLADEDLSEEDDKHIYIPYVTAKEFWESLPSFIQMAVFTLGKGHSADELATLSKRIMLSATHAVPEFLSKFRHQIFAVSNPLLMCTLYYVYYDHGFLKSATALSKVSIDAKHISYLREGIKAVIEKLVKTSVTNGFDKKAEWTNQVKEVEDKELKQAMKNALNNTKGKHGRRTIKQEEVSIDDILIAEDKQALKEAILTALNDIDNIYDIAYIKEALINSKHLKKDISFAVFLRAINAFSGKEYKYDSVLKVDSLIKHHNEVFETSNCSTSKRGRRIVPYLTEIFQAIK